MDRWVYFVCIVLGATVILTGFLIKCTYESTHYLMSSTGHLDVVKFTLNKIALINDEDVLTDKLAFSATP